MSDERTNNGHCPEREDGQHCHHWWDGGVCCGCGADSTYEQLERYNATLRRENEEGKVAQDYIGRTRLELELLRELERAVRAQADHVLPVDAPATIAAALDKLDAARRTSGSGDLADAPQGGGSGEGNDPGGAAGR